ncbi:hypothetical protein K6H11_001377 [Candida tropicalis]|nr:mL50 family ribosomal protein [Asgard group archaeon]
MIRVPVQSRSFATSTRTLSWFGDLFGKNKTSIESQQKRKEIIEKQDELTGQESIKVTHLTYKNSDKYVKFDRKKEMPGYNIRNWKSVRGLHPKDLETHYSNKELLQNKINESLQNVLGKEITREQYKDISLTDLEFRFNVVKALQSSLGIDFNDYTVSKSHDLETLYDAIENVVSTRWKNEKHPDAIVLRPEDFTAGNVYLNEERSTWEKQKEFNKLVQQMKNAEKKQQSV